MVADFDNNISVGPNSKLAYKQDKGLNENLAREIMELHTLGTSGGYTLDDIQNLAKILTGWTVNRGNNKRNSKRKKNGFNRKGERNITSMTRKKSYQTPGTTVFNKSMHEPGVHTLLNTKYGQGGAEQFIEALNNIAKHPNTAKFIATKLAIHYISDRPSNSVIEEIATTFIKTNGHLPSVHATTYDLALEHGVPFTKARDHYSYIVAVARALNMKNKKLKKVMAVLNDLGQRPFSPPGPDGWPDQEADWITPQGLMRRITFAKNAATLMRRNVDARELMQELFSENLTDMTAQHIRRAESPLQGLAIALSSPEMNYA